MKQRLLKRAYLLLFLPVFLAISACGLTDQLLGNSDAAPTAATLPGRGTAGRRRFLAFAGTATAGAARRG